MKILVKAKTGAKESKIKKLKDSQNLFGEIKSELDTYAVWVKERPVAGQANLAIIKLLAEYFEISQSEVVLVSGASTKTKVFDIVSLLR
ncbi:MAG: DUF167 domain-containing protein [Candidatus Paceibacterota bacterium]|jgi:hypothetical protein